MTMKKDELLTALSSGALLQHGSGGWQLVIDESAKVAVAPSAARAIQDQLVQLPGAARSNLETYCLLTGDWTPMSVRAWRHEWNVETHESSRIASIGRATTVASGWAAYRHVELNYAWGWELFTFGDADADGVHDHQHFLAYASTENNARLALVYLADTQMSDWLKSREELREMRLL